MSCDGTGEVSAGDRDAAGDGKASDGERYGAAAAGRLGPAAAGRGTAGDVKATDGEMYDEGVGRLAGD